MPSGAKKRKAAKKKQVQDLNNYSSTTSTHSHHGESDGGELSSPASQDPHDHHRQSEEEVEKREDGSLSKNEAVVIESTEKAGKDEEGNVEFDIESESKSKSKGSRDSSSSFSGSGSSSDDEARIVEKKVVVLESAPVVESVQPVISEKVEELSVETSPVVEPVESVAEEVSQVYDELKKEEKNDVVLAETPVVAEFDNSSSLDQAVILVESGMNDDCATSGVAIESVLKENRVQKLDEKVSSELKDDVVDLMYPKTSVSGANGADHVNQSEPRENTDTQPLVASAPRPVPTTSWKGCCGILELFVGSDR